VIFTIGYEGPMTTSRLREIVESLDALGKKVTMLFDPRAWPTNQSR